MVLLFFGVLVVVFTGVGALPYIELIQKRESLGEKDPQADRLIHEQEVHTNCQYNGHLYMEGERVITEEPCLNCTCTRGSLVCYLRVCPELPNPPPKHCILVHRKNRCCAQLVCQFHQKLRHENEESALLDFAAEKQEGCFINGTTYAEGSAMASSNLCDYCYCIKGKQMCVQPQCVMTLEGCKPYYNTLTCCPTRYDCDQVVLPVSSTASLSTTDCRVDNKVYDEGEMVKEIAKSHCENCFCMKGKIHCVSLSCKPPAENCVPVIKSGECCPTKYNCSDITDGKSTYPNKANINLLQSNKISEEQNGADVVSEGRSHRVMSKLNSNDTVKDEKNHIENEYKTATEIENTSTELSSTTVTTRSETSTETSESTTATTMQDTAADTSAFTTTSTDTTATTITAESTTRVSTTELTTTRKEELVTSLYNISAGNSSEINNKTEFEKPEKKHVSDIEQTTMIMPLRREDYDNILDDDLKLNEAMTMETDTTHYTEVPTTLIIPEDMFVTDITLRRNVSIVERDNILGASVSVSPLRTIPPEIEALINITQNEEDDYEDYDYDDPSLPPSLPNLKIIPFVAADAVLENEDNVKSTLYPLQERRHTTNSPIYSRFSPPVKTEGGFRPRDPIIDGPFYESKMDVPYTTGLNVPAGHLLVDATVGTVPPPAVTLLSRTDATLTSERCFYGEHEYMHGDLVSEPGACLVCVCHHGEVFCQDTKCPPLKPGCRRLRANSNSCCGRIICDDTEFPTIVLDRIEPPLHNPALSGNILPPITVAEGLVTTPDPFRDVIRTEPAPDLPALIGDLKPYLERQSTIVRPSTSVSSTTVSTTTTSTTASTSASTTTSVTTSTTINTSSPTITFTTASTSEEMTSSSAVTSKIKYSIVTPTILLTTKEIVHGDEAESKIMTKPINNTAIPEHNSEVEEEDDDSGSLFDSVLQFFFSGDSTTTSRTTTFSSSNVTSSEIFNYENNDNKENLISNSDNNINIDKIDLLSSLFSENSTNFSESQSESEANITTTVTANSYSSVTEKYEPISSSREPPPGRPPNIDVNADPGAASGILKLAGCNIYGRMYRVGRIISELSTPCLECMCTEVGVQCRPLDC